MRRTGRYLPTFRRTSSLNTGRDQKLSQTRNLQLYPKQLERSLEQAPGSSRRRTRGVYKNKGNQTKCVSRHRGMVGIERVDEITIKQFRHGKEGS